MLVGYIHDKDKSGILFGAYLSRQEAIKLRQVSGDLLFNDNGAIDQSEDWLFDWEKLDSNCYARKAQKATLDVKSYAWRSVHQSGRLR